MKDRMWLVALAALAACGDPPERERRQRDRERAPTLVASYAPRSGGDVLALVVDGQDQAVPRVVDAQGEPVALLPVSWWEVPIGWEPEGGWLPGSYELLGIEGVARDFAEPVAFEVGPWGTGAVPVEGLVGTTWAIEGGFTVPADIAPVAMEVGEASVRIEEVDGDAVQFAVVADVGQGACVLLRERGTWSGSSMRWSRERWVIGADPGPVATWDLGLELHFDPSTPGEAAGRARGLAEAGPLSAALFGDGTDLCQLASAIGSPCVECGGEACVGTPAHALVLREVAPLVGPLPLCGLDPMGSPSIELEPIHCDVSFEPIDCGCSSARTTSLGIPVWFLALAVLRRRRE